MLCLKPYRADGINPKVCVCVEGILDMEDGNFQMAAMQAKFEETIVDLTSRLQVQEAANQTMRRKGRRRKGSRKERKPLKQKSGKLIVEELLFRLWAPYGHVGRAAFACGGAGETSVHGGRKIRNCSVSSPPVPETSIEPPCSCRRSWFSGRGAVGVGVQQRDDHMVSGGGGMPQKQQQQQRFHGGGIHQHQRNFHVFPPARQTHQLTLYESSAGMASSDAAAEAAPLTGDTVFPDASVERAFFLW